MKTVAFLRNSHWENQRNYNSWTPQKCVDLFSTHFKQQVEQDFWKALTKFQRVLYAHCEEFWAESSAESYVVLLYNSRGFVNPSWFY